MESIVEITQEVQNINGCSVVEYHNVVNSRLDRLTQNFAIWFIFQCLVDCTDQGTPSDEEQGAIGLGIPESPHSTSETSNDTNDPETSYHFGDVGARGAFVVGVDFKEMG